MSTNPLVSPKARYFDANGDPLSGGKLYSYEAGTSTLLATYTTRAGSVANANPIILDANGEANVWMTPGVDYKFALYNSADVLQWTVDNVPSPAEEDTTGDVTTEPGGRLSLTTLTPVTTSDVTGATTVYYVPYKHNKVPLYDGTSWAVHSISTELSQTSADTTKSPAAVVALSNYDMFIWDDSGTLRLSRGPAWSTDTTRGTGAGTTELERIDGRYVNKVSVSNGPAANCGLYVGTIRGSSGADFHDQMTDRYVWNMYNRVVRALRVTDSTDSWVYSAATIRQARASTANQVDVVRGLDEDAMFVLAAGTVTSDTITQNASVGIGLDSTTTFVSGIIMGNRSCPNTTHRHSVRSEWTGLPGLGRRSLVWLERGSDGVATLTWSGDVGGSDAHSGLHGNCMA